jgi:hypothetical protein
MRISSFVALLLSLLGAGSLAAQQAEPRPIVVLVHGRGHFGEDSAWMRREWTSVLNAALKEVGHPPLPSADVRLAWYADILDPGKLAPACPARRRESDSLGLDVFADFLGLLADALPRNESREARGLIGDLLYVTDPRRRCAAEMTVGDYIVVVAYSLGALVSYEYLRTRADSSLRVDLVTIGSPLGNPDIRDILGHGRGAVKRPATVRRWENVFDSTDVFSAAVGEANTATDRVARGSTRGDVHAVGRYLGDRATAEALVRLLSR